MTDKANEIQIEQHLAEYLKLARQRKYDEALNLIEKSLERFPLDRKLTKALGILNLHLRRWSQAEVIFGKLTLDHSDTVDTEITAGLLSALIQQRKKEAVEEFLAKVITGGDILAIREASAVCIGLRRFEAGLGLAIHVLETLPADEKALWLRTLALAQLGRQEEAIASAETGLSQIPGHVLLCVIIAELQSLRGNWRVAASQWEHVIVAQGDRAARRLIFYPRGVVSLWSIWIETVERSGDEHKANIIIQKARRKFESSADLLLIEARLATLRRDWGTASSLWNSLLAVDGPKSELIGEAFASAWHFTNQQLNERFSPANCEAISYITPSMRTRSINASVISAAHERQLPASFSGSVQFIEDAFVMPGTPPFDILKEPDRPHQSTGGVYDSGGLLFDNSIQFGPTTNSKPNELFGLVKGFDFLPGKYIYGAGLFNAQPGHFITESIGRFWISELLGEAPDGVVFLSKLRVNMKDKQLDFRSFERYNSKLLTSKEMKFAQQITEFFVGTRNIVVISKPTKIQKLYISSQNFGLSPNFIGANPLFKEFISRRIDKAICGAASSSTRKIFVSRGKMPVLRGALFPEQILEKILLSEGYEIFHPQDHSLQDQFLAYRQASHIIATSGSSAHFIALAMNGSQKVAVIARAKNSVDIFVNQIKYFGALLSVAIDTITQRAEFIDSDGKKLKVSGSWVPHIFDLQQTLSLLKESGFIRNSDLRFWNESESLAAFIERIDEVRPGWKHRFVPA